MRRVPTAVLFVLLGAIFVLPALGPDRVLVPMDLPRDLLAWKGDPSVRVRVSNTLLSDVPLQLVPWDVESRRLIAAGEMPWRNRFAGAGQHLFANPLAALLSPFTWPRLLFGLEGWEWTVFLKLATAALGMVWLARLLGATPFAASLSGAIFAMCGYMTVWSLYPHTNVVALLPALAASALALAREVRPARVAALGLIAALATAGGHPEGLFVGVIAIAVWLFFAEAPRKAPVAASALAGFLLLGIQLVPFALLLARSWVIDARGEQLGIAFRKFSLLSLILPGYLGSPLRGELDLTGVFAGTENFHQRNGAFIGALALLAIVLAYRRLSRPYRAGLAIGGIALVFSLSIPGLAHLLRRVPLVGWTAPEYFAIAFVLFASLAAGPALALVVEGPSRRRLGIALVVIGILGVVGGAFPALAPSAMERIADEGIATLRTRGLLSQPPEVYEERVGYYLVAARMTAIRRVAAPALCWGILGAAFLMPAGMKRTAMATAAVLGELALFGWGYNPAIRVEEIAGEPPALTTVRAADPEGAWSIVSSPEVLAPNLSTLWQVRSLNAYDILVSREEVERLLPAGYEPLRWALPGAPTPDQSRALAALGARFLITPEVALEIPGATRVPPPVNSPPPGLAAGAAVSLAGALLLIALAALAREKGPNGLVANGEHLD